MHDRAKVSPVRPVPADVLGVRARDPIELIRPVTNILPLTLLNDALREISVQGATIWDVRTQILGLLIWTLAGFILAVRLFRFEKF